MPACRLNTFNNYFQLLLLPLLLLLRPNLKPLLLLFRVPTERDSSKTAAVDTNNTLRSSATVKATTTATTTATLPSQTSTSTPLPLSLPPLTICQPQAPTPPYQRLTKALQCDPRCGHEVSEATRLDSPRLDSSCGPHFKCATRHVRRKGWLRGVVREGGGGCWGNVCMLNSDVRAQERNGRKKERNGSY